MYSPERTPRNALHEKQKSLLFNPDQGIEEDYRRIYIEGEFQLGWPANETRRHASLARENTVAFVGAQLGDEGKGRGVDNKIEALLAIPGINVVYVVRFNGGNNSGHSLERNGVRLAVHVVPAAVMYEEAVGIIDQGMLVHPEDLHSEVEYIEAKVGSLQGRLYLSESAILGTDAQRAQEKADDLIAGCKMGGTGRGVSHGYGDHYTKTGLVISDLLADDWRERLGKHYDKYKGGLAGHDIDLAEITVPDFRTTKETGRAQTRQVGDKDTFLNRLADARKWLLDRRMVGDTFCLHKEIYQDPQAAVVFEGAQAMGLHPFLGTRKDVTASDTSAYGIAAGTAFWRPEDITQCIGVFKITYMSSVGVRRMPTVMDPEWAGTVREWAKEFGTTTGRPRDIYWPDLPLLTYNARMGGIEVLMGTHLDIARPDRNILVCTHYIKQGRVVPYRPGLCHLEGVIPQYIELPGWDGEACQKARSSDELPINAQKFLAFIQARTGYPIVAVTTGPSRDNFIALPGYQ